MPSSTGNGAVYLGSFDHLLDQLVVEPVVCQYLAHYLRGPPKVVVEDTSEPFPAVDGTIHVGAAARLLDQLVVKPLVVALKVVVVRVFFHHFS